MEKNVRLCEMLLNKLLGFFLIPKKEQLYNSVVTYFSKSLHGIRFFRKMLNFIYVTCLFMMTISLKPGSIAYFIIQKRLLNYNHALNHGINIDMEFNIKL